MNRARVPRGRDINYKFGCRLFELIRVFTVLEKVGYFACVVRKLSLI